MNRKYAMAAFAALCLSGTSVYAASNEGLQEADATVSVTSPFSFTHTLTGQSFSAGQIVDGTTVAKGTVSTGGDNRINTVTLSWNNSVNPVFLFGTNTAMMERKGDSDVDDAIPVEFTADTPSNIVHTTKYGTEFQLSTPGNMFRYTIRVAKFGPHDAGGNKFTLRSGDYRLAAIADVTAA
ncbi:hypothetical protein BFM03_23175 [Salmonella enterica]|nr:hypothetical protein [Salmonella enterica subsp. enterica serovar 9,12:-:1,5]